MVVRRRIILEHKEAVALLREMIECNVAQPFLVSLNENRYDEFYLVMKDDCNIQALKLFVGRKKPPYRSR